jgi:hypothetical protein
MRSIFKLLLFILIPGSAFSLDREAAKTVEVLDGEDSGSTLVFRPPPLSAQGRNLDTKINLGSFYFVNTDYGHDGPYTVLTTQDGRSFRCLEDESKNLNLFSYLKLFKKDPEEKPYYLIYKDPQGGRIDEYYVLTPPQMELIEEEWQRERWYRSWFGRTQRLYYGSIKLSAGPASKIWQWMARGADFTVEKAAEITSDWSFMQIENGEDLEPRIAPWMEDKREAAEMSLDNLKPFSFYSARYPLAVRRVFNHLLEKAP